MRPENTAMKNFLAAHGIRATPRYEWKGSMRGTWYLYDGDTRWTDELCAKLTALGFADFDGKPLGRFAGNGGSFSVSVRGHNELLTLKSEHAPANLNVEISDGGRSAAGFDKERSDCSVRATAAAMGITYAEAHAKLAALGRKPRAGFVFRGKRVEPLGFVLRGDLTAPTFAKTLPNLAKGRFVVRVRRHVFAVVDSKVFDHAAPGAGKRVEMVYEYLSPAANTCTLA